MKGKIAKWIKILLLAGITIYFLQSVPTTISLIGGKHGDWVINRYNPYRGYEALIVMFAYIETLVSEVTILFFSIRGLIGCFLPVGELKLLTKASRKYGWKLPAGLISASVLLWAGEVYLERAIHNLPEQPEGDGHMTLMFWAYCLGVVIWIIFELAVITLAAQIKMHIRNRKKRAQQPAA